MEFRCSSADYNLEKKTILLLGLPFYLVGQWFHIGIPIYGRGYG